MHSFFKAFFFLIICRNYSFSRTFQQVWWRARALQAPQLKC